MFGGPPGCALVAEVLALRASAVGLSPEVEKSDEARLASCTAFENQLL